MVVGETTLEVADRSSNGGLYNLQMFFISLIPLHDGHVTCILNGVNF